MSKLTVNQVIKLYEYYSAKPDEIFQLKTKAGVSSPVFDSIYNEVVTNDGRIPSPLILALNLTTEQYDDIKEDTNYIYKIVSICESCYKAIKILLEN